MFKSKHSGWTWDLKRTPFGGGGGWNPIAAITDPISSALGTDGGGGGLLGAVADIDPGPAIGNTLASIDPGPAIGSGLADVDKFVNNEVPGGWYTVGAAALGGTALYFAPEIMAAMGTQAGTAITTEAGKEAFFAALANGAPSTQAISAGLAAEAGLAGTAGTLTTEQILGSTGFTPAPSSGASFAIDPAAAYTAGGSSVADIGMGTNAPLQGPTYQELGVTGVPEGGMGPTYGEMGYTGLNTEEAISAADAAARSSQIQEALKTANQVRQGVGTANKIAKLLSPTSQAAVKTGTQAGANAGSQFINAAQNLAQFTPEQFGGYYQMNKNPFTFSNPMANALAKGSGLDVSGTGGQALNTTNQTANLLRTLV